jgi:ABC-type multidrug transport system fused ATPase/permease subunit
MNEKEIWDESVKDNESIDITGDIEFDNVNFAYPARQDAPVLRNLSFVARAGEMTALVGVSGCGKSFKRIFMSEKWIVVCQTLLIKALVRWNIVR